MKLLGTLSILIMSVALCSGQNNTQPWDAMNMPKKGPGSPKITRTQATGPHVSIHCGLKDKDGNLWFGTNGEGVYRYDGKLFTQFTTKDGLSHNYVWCIIQDNAGLIWLGTTNGICRYDGKNFISIPIPKGIFPSTSSNAYYNDWSTKNTVWSIMQDKSGKLWFGTGDGVYCYNGKSFTPFPGNSGINNKDNLHLKMISTIVEDDSGYIWFASGMLPGMEGLIRYDGKSLINYKRPGQEWIFNAVDDKKGNLWLATRHNGIVKFDRKKFTKIPVNGEVGLACFLDRQGNVWFSSHEKAAKGNLWRYDGTSLKNFTTKDVLGGHPVWCMIEDDAGNIWIGTGNKGLYRYDGKVVTSFSE